ncbi:MAG TPA: ribonuclease P protein component [bacterium]|nr:ribonuclease P protein component [bacterium]
MSAPRLTLPRAARLAARDAIDGVFRDGKFAHGRLLVLGCRAAGGMLTRCAIIIPRKRCAKSSARNRTRRLLRELFRQSRPRLAPGYDVVVLPRAARAAGDFRRWSDEWQALCRKAGLWRDAA